MSDDSSPQQRSKIESGAPPIASPPLPDPDLNPQNNKALTEAINDILKGIPFIGPYIVIVKLKWGWTGILLVIGGFMIAAILVLTGLFPAGAVSNRYKAEQSQTYELKSQQDISWDAAIRSAKFKVWASGVSLSKLNPQLITEKVKEGVMAQVVYANPCGDTINKRQVDEDNPNAVGRIKTNLRTFDTYTKDFNETQKNSLQVKLTDVYPTMIVIIIDTDLYAYFCPYGAVCTNSPVLVFKGYHDKTPQNASAKFFEDHFKAVSSKATPITNYREPCSSPNP